MKWTTLRLLGALFAITLVAAACGSDTTETTTDAAAEVADDAMDDDAMDDEAMDDGEHTDDHDEHGDEDDHGHDGHGGPLEVTAGSPIPEVAIDVTPTDTPGMFTIEVSLTNFTITPENIDGDPIDNEGHMHLLLDGEKVERFTELTHSVMVPEGEHLVERDDRAVGRPGGHSEVDHPLPTAGIQLTRLVAVGDVPDDDTVALERAGQAARGRQLRAIGGPHQVGGHGSRESVDLGAVGGDEHGAPVREAEGEGVGR